MLCQRSSSLTLNMTQPTVWTVKMEVISCDVNSNESLSKGKLNPLLQFTFFPCQLTVLLTLLVILDLAIECEQFTFLQRV